MRAWQQVVERGYEGLVAKDERSRYFPGASPGWLKVKVRHEGRFLIGGIVDNEGDFGGILVGERVAGELLYRGTIEWGFTGWSVTELLVRSPRVSTRGLSSPWRSLAPRSNTCVR